MKYNKIVLITLVLFFLISSGAFAYTLVNFYRNKPLLNAHSKNLITPTPKAALIPSPIIASISATPVPTFLAIPKQSPTIIPIPTPEMVTIKFDCHENTYNCPKEKISEIIEICNKQKNNPGDGLEKIAIGFKVTELIDASCTKIEP